MMRHIPVAACIGNFKRPFSASGRVPMDLWVVNDTIYRSRIGDFSGRSSARGAMFRGVLASRASEGQGDCRLGAEPDGIGDRWGISPVGIDRRPAPVLGRCPGGLAQMREGLGDDGGMLDGGE
jgi:hypothetical protein